jgi:hypothetical protein
MIATAAVRGRPVFRPRIVMSPLKPMGRPVLTRNWSIGLNSETRRGTRATLPT